MRNNTAQFNDTNSTEMTKSCMAMITSASEQRYLQGEKG